MHSDRMVSAPRRSRPFAANLGRRQYEDTERRTIVREHEKLGKDLHTWTKEVGKHRGETLEKKSRQIK